MSLKTAAWQRRLSLVLLCGGATVTQAHHSVTATYDTKQEIALEGTVREFELSTPHSRLSFDVRGAHGGTILWQAELPAAVFLRRAGWDDHSLGTGEHVHIKGAPSRNNPTALYITDVIKADGTHLALLPASVIPTAADDKDGQRR